MRPYRYDLAVFDLDGTLLDTSRGILAALSDTLAEYGRVDVPDEDLTAFIGPPIEVALRELLGLRDEALDRAASRFRTRYREKHLKKAAPYTGILPLLEMLTALGIQKAVATYKREEYARNLLCHFGFTERIPVIFGSDRAGLLQKSDLIRRCMAASGINDPTRTVMIGDTAEDARGAKEVGCDFIAVTYGFGFTTVEKAKALGPVGIAESPMDILPYVIGKERGKSCEYPIISPIF